MRCYSFKKLINFIQINNKIVLRMTFYAKMRHYCLVSSSPVQTLTALLITGHLHGQDALKRLHFDLFLVIWLHDQIRMGINSLFSTQSAAWGIRQRRHCWWTIETQMAAIFLQRNRILCLSMVDFKCPFLL